MRMARELAQGFLVATVFAGFTFPGISQARDSEFTDWIGNNGKVINAKVVGFNADQKQIKWEFPGGGTAFSSPSSLTPESRSQLIVEPVILKFIEENLDSYDFEKASKKYLLGLGFFILILLFFVYLFDFLAFKLAIRFLAESNDDLLAYVKLIASGILISIVSSVLVFFAGGTETFTGAMMNLAFSLASIFIGFWILMSHYQIGVLRTLAVNLTRGAIAVIIIVITGVITAVAITAFAWTMSEHFPSFIDEVVYRPMGIL